MNPRPHPKCIEQLPENWACRRYNFLRQVADEVSSELLTSGEAAQLLFARLDVAKRVLRTSRRRVIIDRSLSGSKQAYACPVEVLPEPPAPSSILSRLNRSWVFPPIVPPKPDIHRLGTRLDEVLDNLRETKRSNLLPTKSWICWLVLQGCRGLAQRKYYSTKR